MICADIAHVETDECGAPEFFSNGSKLLLGRSEQGKLTPAAIREIALKRKDIHYPKPRVVSLTQATEVGTVYQPRNCARSAIPARSLACICTWMVPALPMPALISALLLPS